MILLQFYSMILTQFGSSIQRFRTDNVRDYFNHHLRHFFNEKGVVHESSCINTPQQNEVVERKMRHLLNVTITLLHHSNVPKSFWGEAVLAATYLINRVPSMQLISLIECPPNFLAITVLSNVSYLTFLILACIPLFLLGSLDVLPLSTYLNRLGTSWILGLFAAFFLATPLLKNATNVIIFLPENSLFLKM